MILYSQKLIFGQTESMLSRKAAYPAKTSVRKNEGSKDYSKLYGDCESDGLEKIDGKRGIWEQVSL